MSDLPSSYTPESLEEKISQQWVKEKRFAYDSRRPRGETFVIDTPPPTVSGSLHMGHVYSYTQTDIIARYQRMQGKNLYYPIGWDDNGLPTERRVQNLFGIKCNATLPYDLGFKAILLPINEGKQKSKLSTLQFKEVSRQNFIETCALQTKEDEIKYQQLWQRLGLSIDWSLQYETINDHCRSASQRSFLDLIEKGHAYFADRPVTWDTEFQTSVAQADIVDKEVQGHFHDIRFQVHHEGKATGESFVISTTRPELLAACIAVVAHPDDERYQGLFGKTAVTPLFHAPVPIMPALHANPEKGTGILMVCTFGDVHDVEFWRKENLPLKQIIAPQGTIATNIIFAKSAQESIFTSLDPEKANAAMEKIAGLHTAKAKKVMAQLLSEPEVNALVGELKPTLQNVRFYEKGQFPLEYMPARQWYIKVLDYQGQLLEQGRKIQWHPEHTFKKYEQWVEGLAQDWCISRQRYFGVPFPVWYPILEDGTTDFDHPLYASMDQLPVDPLTQAPKGYSENQRGIPGGFAGDMAVMDTWATSSLTPQISSHWGKDERRHQALFPADMRPQAHEIIRTWAFYTITKSWMHEGQIPWKHIAISGWVVTNDKEKMSKSAGNTKTPDELIVRFSADAIRYWAGKAKLGQDTVYAENMFAIGNKLVMKLFNSSKFTLGQLTKENFNASLITYPSDINWITRLNAVITESKKHFELFDYAQALTITEGAFWEFCDHYIELVKGRSYRLAHTPEGISALMALEFSLGVFLKLLAPFVPFITEEIWSWHDFGRAFPEDNTNKLASVHTSSWPKELAIASDDTKLFSLTALVLKAAREKKTKMQKSMKWPIEDAAFYGEKKDYDLLMQVSYDLESSCSFKTSLRYAGAADDGQERVEIELAEHNNA